MDEALMEQAARSVQSLFPEMKPDFGLVLGSGWGDVAEALDPVDTAPYDRVDGWGATAVEGHAGRLLRVKVGGREGLVFQGRRHWYEGEGWTPVALPVYVLKSLGARALLLTNGAGGVNPDFAPGDLMVIRDHINAMGTNPLIGPYRPFWGTRFPDQTSLYDPALRRHLLDLGRTLGISVKDGVYLAATGPVYETPAEVRAFAGMGADAVGMSTVPEAMLASAAGLRVAGLSCITNAAAGLSGKPLAHTEVMEAGRAALPGMQRLIRRFFEEALA